MNRMLLVIAAIAAVAGVAVFKVVRTRAPGRNYDAAKAEIERWEERANKVRSCLLGTTPTSPIAAEALAIRDISNNPPDFKACTASISALSRGEAPDTGIKEVEDEWRALTKAIGGVANSFAQVLVNKAHAVDELGDALDTLDVAHSNLRQAAEMDPPPTGRNAKASLAETELIMIGTAKKSKLSAWLRPSAGGMVALVEGAGRPAQQLVLVPGQPPKRTPYKADVRPSITDPAWGAQAATGDLAHGKLMADGSVEKAASKPITDKAMPSILFTLGSAADGAIAYLTDTASETPKLAVARVGAAGFEPGAPIETDDYAFALDPPNRGLVAWSTKNTLHGQLVELTRTGTVQAGSGSATTVALPHAKPIELGAGHSGLSCLSRRHGWIASSEQLFAFDDKEKLSVEMRDHELVGCDASAVLMREAGHRYSVCGVTPVRVLPKTGPGAVIPAKLVCRVVELPAGPDALPGLSSGKAIAVAARQRVLAVWKEGAEVRYFVMPVAFKPKLVQATEKIVDLLGETDDGLAILRASL